MIITPMGTGKISIESDGDSVVSDLHLLRVGLREFAVVASVVTDEPRTPEDYKARLRQHEELAHVTIEVNRCDEHRGIRHDRVTSFQS